MNCCVNCFSDLGLKSRVEALSNAKGICAFCESTNVIIVDCALLGNSFDALFELYINSGEPSLSLENERSYLLHEHLIAYWPKLFNTELLKDKDVNQLVNQIGRNSQHYSQQLFEQPVELELLMVLKANPAEDFGLKWDSFSAEIREKNRFFLNDMIDTELLESTFSRLAVTYPRDTLFYRARISEEPLPMEKLGKPPHDKASPGRANPVGISYLYISESEKTTLYETRIALHEGITIGKFVAKESINVISLKNITDYGPYEILDRDFTLEEFISRRPYLQKLENELSKPVRKQDQHLDYLPTQFLCEFIKSLGFDGVAYKSAMNSEGYNLAVFNEKKLECVEAMFYTVKDLKYSWQ